MSRTKQDPYYFIMFSYCVYMCVVTLMHTHCGSSRRTRVNHLSRLSLVTVLYWAQKYESFQGSQGHLPITELTLALTVSEGRVHDHHLQQSWTAGSTAAGRLGWDWSSN